MTGAEIIALITGLPAVIAAITAFLTSIRAKNNAIIAQKAATEMHLLMMSHVYPVQPESPQSTESS